MDIAMKPPHAALLVVATFASLSSQAALFDRGGGLIYDDVLNVTWLQDANFAKTSGYDSDGKMKWWEATAWVDQLIYAGFDDWRLPRNSAVNPPYLNLRFAFDGSTDIGFGITSKNVEMAYMYTVNLELPTYYCYPITIPSTCNLPPYDQPISAGPFANLNSEAYWGNSRNPEYFVNAFSFNFFGGSQGTNWIAQEFYAWAVRDGDVPALPEPETYALFLAGLGLLGVAAKRKAKLDG